MGLALFHRVELSPDLLSQFLLYNPGLSAFAERMSMIFGVHLISAVFIASFQGPVGHADALIVKLIILWAIDLMMPV